MKYSVIIPTFNRANNLKENIRSLFLQRFQDRFEIIVVDDGSKDSTRKVIEVLQSEMSNSSEGRFELIYLYQKNQGCAAARNTGIKASLGEFIFFTDDDCVLPYNWMQILFNGLQEFPEALGVGGWYESSPELLEKNNRAKMLYLQYNANVNTRKFKQIGNMFRESHAGNTANMLYKKEIFQRFGYFDEYTKLTARIDWEFKIRLNYMGQTLAYIPFVIEHNKSFSWSEFLKKSFNYGVSDYFLSHKYIGLKNVYFIGFGNIFQKYAQWKRLHNECNKEYFMMLFLRLVGYKYAKFKKIKTKQIIVNQNLINFNKNFDENRIEQFYSEINYINLKNTSDFLLSQCEAIRTLNNSQGKLLFSIIIPIFNRVNFINKNFIEAFNSLEVGKDNLEIIFVDDCSIDDTVKKLEEILVLIKFQSKIVRKEKNSGPAATRNEGLKKALGRYVFFTDSDTLVTKYLIRDLYTVFLYDKRVACVGGFQYNETPKTIFDQWRNMKTLQSKNLIIQNYNRSLLPADSACLMIDTDKIKNVFNNSFGKNGLEDYEFIEKIKSQGHYVAFLPVFVKNLRLLSHKDFITLLENRALGLKSLSQDMSFSEIKVETLPNREYLLGMLLLLISNLFSSRVFRLQLLNFYAMLYKSVFFHNNSIK